MMTQSGSSNVQSSMPVYFIPHQIQRQLPTQRQAQATFVPTGQNNMISNANNSGQFNQQTVNYTVTPMQVPSVVHNVPSASQSSGNKSKSKNGQDKGFISINKIFQFILLFIF